MGRKKGSKKGSGSGYEPKPGDAVFAKVPGFPHWPAEVVEPHQAPAGHDIHTVKHAQSDMMVMFFETGHR